nr:hypothetical protein [Tanacetum cinerariifolium]
MFESYNLCTKLVDFTDMALPPRDQRYRYLRFERLQYTKGDIANFKIRMLIEHQDAQGQSLFTSQAWRRPFDIRGPLLGGARRHICWRHFILALGLHTTEEIETVGFNAYWAKSARQIPDKDDLRDYWIGISSTGDFLGTAQSYTSFRDLILRLCHRLIESNIAGRSQALEKVTVTDLFYLRWLDIGSVNIPYILSRYLRRFVAGRKSEALISGGQSMLSSETLGPGYPQDVLGRRVMHEEFLRRLRWHQEEEVHGMHEILQGQREVLDNIACDFSRFTTWTVTSLSRMMDKAGVTYTRYSESSVEYQRCTVRHRTDEPSTSATPQHHDP